VKSEKDDLEKALADSLERLTAHREQDREFHRKFSETCTNMVFSFFRKRVGKLWSLIKTRYRLFYCHCSEL
jgi:DNA-binding FadR family transcriptional regulator